MKTKNKARYLLFVAVLVLCVAAVIFASGCSKDKGKTEENKMNLDEWFESEEGQKYFGEVKAGMESDPDVKECKIYVQGENTVVVEVLYNSSAASLKDLPNADQLEDEIVRNRDYFRAGIINRVTNGMQKHSIIYKIENSSGKMLTYYSINFEGFQQYNG